jgi:hypothetical protein
MTAPLHRFLALAALLALFGGCAPAEPETLLLVRGPAEVAGTGPAWCYATLADPDCYVARDPAASHRLIGAYVPAGEADEPPPRGD